MSLQFRSEKCTNTFSNHCQFFTGNSRNFQDLIQYIALYMKKKMVGGFVFRISIVVFQFCSQSHGQASLCLAFSGHTADELPKTAGPLRKNTTRTFSIRITSLINSWQTEYTRAGITGKMMIYLFPNCRQLWILPQKANKKPRKYLMTLCFSMTTNIIYDPLCNDMSIIHWKAV